MSRVSLALCGLAVICWATGAGGQSVTPLRLGVALGTTLGDNSWVPHGAHGVLSLTSQPAGSRFGLRVEALFEGDERFYDYSVGYSYTARTSTAALLISTTYRLWGPRTGLYAIGGLGVYRQWQGVRVDPIDGETTTSHRTVTGLGINLGLGYDFKAFGREAFVESRFLSGVFTGLFPISVGIRF
jgi:hypothetical protein